jgi:hypothetical protein
MRPPLAPNVASQDRPTIGHVKSLLAHERLKVSSVAGLDKDKEKQEGRFTGHRLLQNASRHIGGRLFITT